jgi:hypothetical protein
MPVKLIHRQQRRRLEQLSGHLTQNLSPGLQSARLHFQRTLQCFGRLSLRSKSSHYAMKPEIKLHFESGLIEVALIRAKKGTPR